MMKKILLATAIALLALPVGRHILKAQNMGNHMMDGHKMGGHMMDKGRMMGRRSGGRHMGNFIRHRIIMMGGGVPAAYASMKNPLPASDENVRAGGKLYADNCASCHGPRGAGDGEAGRELSPRPANIAFVIDKPIATDPFFFWTISEGGEALKTAMPAFRDVLSEKERWQIIHYLRKGLGQ